MLPEWLAALRLISGNTGADPGFVIGVAGTTLVYQTIRPSGRACMGHDFAGDARKERFWSPRSRANGLSSAKRINVFLCFGGFARITPDARCSSNSNRAARQDELHNSVPSQRHRLNGLSLDPGHRKSSAAKRAIPVTRVEARALSLRIRCPRIAAKGPAIPARGGSARRYPR